MDLAHSVAIAPPLSIGVLKERGMLTLNKIIKKYPVVKSHDRGFSQQDIFGFNLYFNHDYNID